MSKKRIGFKPTEEQICDLVKDQVDAKLKKIRGMVKEEVKDALSDMEGRLRVMEERMIATFGKIQGEIEMLSHMEAKEDQTLLGRIERLEMEAIQMRKEMEEIKALLKALADKISKTP